MKTSPLNYALAVRKGVVIKKNASQVSRGLTAVEQTHNKVSTCGGERGDARVHPPKTGGGGVQSYRTLEIVRAGDHWSLRMSKQIPPLLFMLQW